MFSADRNHWSKLVNAEQCWFHAAYDSICINIHNNLPKLPQLFSEFWFIPNSYLSVTCTQMIAAMDFVSRHYIMTCKKLQKHKNIKIWKNGSFKHNKKSKGRTHKFNKTVKMLFSAVAWTCAPYLWWYILKAVGNLSLCMSNNFPLRLSGCSG